MRRTLLPILLVLLLAAVVGGCGSGGDDEGSPAQPTEPTEPTTAETETAPPATTEAEPGTTAVRVYLMRGEKLGVGLREVEATEAVGRAALEELLAGPNAAEAEAGLHSEVPDGTELLGLAIEDGHAVADLSRAFESGGGSLSMTARVAQVVYALTQFPTVDRVSITLDGEEVDAIGGEGVAARELTRADFEDVTPQIFVESPAVGEPVTSPLRIRGTANTFEATFMVEIRSGDEVLTEDFVTATSGSGERGTFEASFPFETGAAGPFTLVVYEASAEDGSPLHRVEIPLDVTS